MKRRLEYKYLVPNEMLGKLRADMLNYLTYDPFALKQPEKEYLVRSIYLDTAGYKSYFDKTEGLETRSKFRVRGYDYKTDESVVFLEIKKKKKDFISKSRCRIYYRDLNLFFRTNDISKYIIADGMAEKENASHFLYYYYLHKLTPAFSVVYNREAFQCKFGSDLRITFDKNVRCAPVRALDELYEENNFKSSWPGSFILELKFNMILPAWLPHLLNKYRLQRVSASKYAICFDVYRGIMKYNKTSAAELLTKG